MELHLQRRYFTDLSTIGELTHNGHRICFILEDTDRGLEQSHPLNFIASKKVFGKTAIPLGSYQIIISFSNRFQKPLPLLLNVPGFEGVRAHPGNFVTNTDGCLLPCTDYELINKDEYKGNNSRVAFLALSSEIEKAMKAEKVFITIQR